MFFRCWFGIVVFGLANGFVLLPVMLSFFGPTDTMIDHNASTSETGGTPSHRKLNRDSTIMTTMHGADMIDTFALSPDEKLKYNEADESPFSAITPDK